MPIVNSNPKIGTAFGVLAGYIKMFDAKSRPSLFGTQVQYSDTDSLVGGFFAKTSWDEDNQRIIGGLMYGNVKNDYDDYLGTGVPLRSTGELRSGIFRYLNRIRGDWFIGGQAIYQNFFVGGATADDDLILDIVGVEPYKSGGAGAVVYRDTRDNENKPTSGSLLSINNMAYRDSLGGEEDFDVMRVDFRYYRTHGEGNVFTFRQLNHLTYDAPTIARASIQLRGYKMGEYSAEFMSSLEAEERFRIAERWTATVFGGVACLYGGDAGCSDGENRYSMYGVGLQYVLKPQQGMVINLEYADGEGDNYGTYLKFGYAY
jgi:hypothetical protein